MRVFRNISEKLATNNPPGNIVNTLNYIVYFLKGIFVAYPFAFIDGAAVFFKFLVLFSKLSTCWDFMRCPILLFLLR